MAVVVRLKVLSLVALIDACLVIITMRSNLCIVFSFFFFFKYGFDDDSFLLVKILQAWRSVLTKCNSLNKLNSCEPSRLIVASFCGSVCLFLSGASGILGYLNLRDLFVASRLNFLRDSVDHAKRLCVKK